MEEMSKMLKKKKVHVKTSVFKVMIVNLIAQELPIFEEYILQCIYPLRKKIVGGQFNHYCKEDFLEVEY